MPEEKKIEGKTASEWFDLGRKAKDLEEYDYAIKCYCKALELNPNDSIKQVISGDLDEVMFWNLFLGLVAGIKEEEREEAMAEIVRFTDEYFRKKSREE